MEINVTVNGEKQHIIEGTSVSSLLNMMNISPQLVAIEYNMEILDKKQFDSVLLKEGDRLEIITFVGGGNG
ncbi:MAG: sulfur carrier protein ThiS [Nitrospirae bacterium]|nr:sulfur carrier protein ThiS [Nitrospirota bacterium]